MCQSVGTLRTCCLTTENSRSHRWTFCIPLSKFDRPNHLHWSTKMPSARTWSKIEMLHLQASMLTLARLLVPVSAPHEKAWHRKTSSNRHREETCSHLCHQRVKTRLLKLLKRPIYSEKVHQRRLTYIKSHRTCSSMAQAPTAK